MIDKELWIDEELFSVEKTIITPEELQKEKEELAVLRERVIRSGTRYKKDKEAYLAKRDYVCVREATSCDKLFDKGATDYGGFYIMCDGETLEHNDKPEQPNDTPNEDEVTENEA